MSRHFQGSFYFYILVRAPFPMQVLVSLCLWAPSKYKIQQGKLNFVKKSQIPSVRPVNFIDWFV